jgi:hypothetical protein
VFPITLLALVGLTLWGLAAWSFAEEYSMTATDLLAQGVSSGQVQTSEGVGRESSSEKAMSDNPTAMPKAEQSEADDITSRGAQLPHPPLIKPLQYLFRPNGAFACIQDNPQSRDLSGSMSQSMTMTNAQCRDQCKAGMFVFAGTQNGSQCFCGNTFGNFGLSNACTMGCSGYNGEICGGPLANSVSMTGSMPSMLMQIIPKPLIPTMAPNNGGLCVMDLSGQDMHSNYRHTEIHQWIATGPSVMNPMGAGSLIPMNWTITGNGYLEELPAVAGGTTNLRIWTISGGRGVHINLVVIGGNLLFHPSEPAASVVGTLHEHQQQWIGGVAQTPGDSTGGWSEIDYGITLTGQANANPISVSTYTPPVQALKGYSQQGMVTGTVTCQWNNVMR